MHCGLQGLCTSSRQYISANFSLICSITYISNMSQFRPLDFDVFRVDHCGKFLERTDPYRRCLIHNDLDICQRQGTDIDLSTQLTDPQPLSTPPYTPSTSVSDVSSSYEFPDILLFEHAC